jgi:hypothetical protein
MSSTWAFISAICSSVMTGLPSWLRPSSFSVSARAIQSRRHVLNFMSGEKMYCICLLA